jgi:hypothetical protein
MSTSKSENKAFNDAANSAEGVRQVAVAGATQSASRTAEIAYYRTLYSAAVANGVSPSNFVQALFSLGVRS